MMLTIGNNPTYNASLDCERIVELGKQGKSKSEMAAHLGVSRETVRLWEKKYTAFKEAMELALTHSQAWWENKGQEALLYDKFQCAIYNKIITCRFREDYGDKVETTLKNAPGETLATTSLTPEEAARNYNNLLEKIK